MQGNMVGLFCGTTFSIDIFRLNLCLITPSDLDSPKTLVVCTEDRVFPRELQLLTGQTWGARIVEVASGHSPWMVGGVRERLVGVVVEEALRG